MLTHANRTSLLSTDIEKLARFPQSKANQLVGVSLIGSAAG